MTSTASPQEIAAKNDTIRRSMVNCRVIITAGVRALDQEKFNKVIELVRAFDQFTLDDDPYGEHDFGKVHFEGVDYFWKFDYYDKRFEGFEHDGQRLLTILRADEY